MEYKKRNTSPLRNLILQTQPQTHRRLAARSRSAHIRAVMQSTRRIFEEQNEKMEREGMHKADLESAASLRKATRSLPARRLK